MARQLRKKSGTGIYHVMVRGINRQDIFEDEEDYFRTSLRTRKTIYRWFPSSGLCPIGMTSKV